MNLKRLAESALAALLVVLVGVVSVLVVVGFAFAACHYPISALAVSVGIGFTALWRDAYNNL